jgi:hypothetical protein
LKGYKNEYEEIKIKTKDTFIAKANEVIQKYLAHLLDENVIKATSGRDSAIIIGTLRDKISLEKGEPTERVEANITVPSEKAKKLTEEILEGNGT